jgi:hypothetical protein
MIDGVNDSDAHAAELADRLRGMLCHVNLIPVNAVKGTTQKRSSRERIRSFMDAEMVITDSFHGCVFAILFNKPFWVIVNEDRGRERFDSLLKMFDLQDRIITQGQQPEWDRKIDWKQVNAIHQEMKRRSLDFLELSLKR